MKLLRWKYVLPRLLLLLTVVLSIHFGLDPLVRYGLVVGSESAVGAKVELASLRSSLMQGELMLGQLQIANPRSPMRNLFQAERGRLLFDTQALLDKRLVVRSGTLRGIEWDTPRVPSGDLAAEKAIAGENQSEPAGPPSWLESGRQKGADWLAGTRARLEQDLAGKLETPRVVQQLRARWPRQLAEMRGRVDTLRGQVQQLQGQMKSFGKNPLRGMEQMEQLQQSLHSVQQELLSVQGELNRLPQQAGKDRQAIQVARVHDQKMLRDTLSGDGLNGEQLSEQLLGPVVAERLKVVLHWVRTIRALAPNRPVRAKTGSARGVDVHFVGQRPQPRLLVQQLALTGTVRMGATSTDWIGTLRDVSDQPSLLEKPTHLHVQGIGMLDFTVDATLDRTGVVARDTFRMDCPDFPLPSKTVGGGTLALRLDLGKTKLQVALNLTEDRLEGRVHLKQSAVRMQQINKPSFADKSVVAKLNRLVGQSLAGIEQLETTVELAGTLQQPAWRIESNLGPELAQGINQATRRLLQQQATAVQDSIARQAEKQMVQLDGQRQEAQQKLLTRLGDSRQLIEQLARLGGERGRSVPKLGMQPSVLKKIGLVR